VPPESFGPYRVVHQIGAGTLGPVFRAFDPATDRAVAVKLFTVDLAPELAHQFVADLDRLVAAELTHPSIARPIATGILGNSPYLVEEFVEGESLDIALRIHGPAPVPDALRIATQIAGALDFAAVSHLHHGALHPRDVLLSNQDVRVTGLGVARALEQVGITSPMRRPYAAPERVGGGVWHRFADIFSLAALMYELLWGRRLNGAGVQAVATLEPLPGGDLTALSLAFSRALAEDPGGRYSRALKFVEALKNAFPGDADTDDIKSSHAFPPPPDVEEPTPIADEPVLYVQRPELVEQQHPAEAQPSQVKPRPTPPTLETPRPLPVIVEEPQHASDTLILTPPATPDLVLQQEEAEAEAVSEPPPEAVGEQPRPLPFDLGPRRRDRARYVPPVDEAESESDALLEDDTASVGHDHPMLSTLERTRSALWPLTLALVIGVGMGVAIGFGGGYWSAFRTTVGAPAPAATTAAAAPQPREYTDSVVPDAAKPAATAAAVPAPVAPPVAPPSPSRPAAEAETVSRNPVPPSNPAPASRALGRILVRSTPAGARVIVDGRESGVTPLAVRDLAVGTHVVRVMRDGFTPEERRFRITRSRPSQSMVVALERPRATAAASFTGGLTVDSRPPGAKVYIDGRLVGTTPLESRGVSAGEHAIRLERDGYRRWTSAVRVVSNEQNRVTASLER